MSKIRLTCSRRLAVNLTAPTACRSILPSRPCLRCNRSLTITSVRHQSTLRPSTYTLNSQTYETDDNSNTPPSIISKLQRKLHLLPNHPISILRQIVESHFGSSFTSISPTSPIVSVHQNFEELGFAPDHPGRSLTDSYYLNKEYMLRTHTSAHEVETYRRGLNRWLLSADVYRRDEIDASHYPVFHQMEGTQIWPSSELSTLSSLNTSLEKHLAGCNLIIEDPTQIGPSNPYQKQHNPKHAEQIARHLKNSLNSLIWKLFGPVATKDGEPLKIRWIEAFFPFTTPSYEVEIWWNGEWLELLGCGVVMQKTLDQAGMPHKSGWAFGLGLDRLTMVLFQIPDIRLFWSTDPRFLSQFKPGIITPFKPYSRYPANLKDMSFWIPTTGVVTGGNGSNGGGGARREWHENDYCEIVRDVAGDLVETVTMIDEFVHPKTERRSKTYRINYRSMDRSLSNDQVNALQAEISRRVIDQMGIEMR